MHDQRALWASTEMPGGISTYVQVMQQTPLWTNWNIRLVVTHRGGSAGAKIVSFAHGALLFVVELIRLRPNVVHLHTASGASFARKAILLWLSWPARVPVVLHMHGSRIQNYYDNAPRAIRALIRSTLCHASAVVALGEVRAARWRAIAPSARIAVIPNAVQPAHRAAPSTSGESVHVVFLGRIGDHKGVFRLLDAWAQFIGDADVTSIPPGAATLTLAGDGEVQRARDRVRELHLQDSVEVSDWLSEGEAGELLDRADVLVLPSISEGQPMAVLEAMARGLCVVASSVGGLPEMIGDGCGVIIPPLDTEAITAALRLVVTDDELRARCGAAAYARVAEQYDVRVVWRQLDELYSEVSR
jgi:glycosyltransferase involved in cell wall biosynthesis